MDYVEGAINAVNGRMDSVNERTDSMQREMSRKFFQLIKMYEESNKTASASSTGKA